MTECVIPCASTDVQIRIPYDIQSSLIYKCIRWSFLHIKSDDDIFNTRKKRKLYRLCQFLALLLGWSYFGYQCYQMYEWYLDAAKKGDLLVNAMDLIYQISHTLWLVALQNTGFFILRCHPAMLK